MGWHMENTSKVRERERGDTERERERERERRRDRQREREREKRERWMKEGLDENINLLILFSSPQNFAFGINKIRPQDVGPQSVFRFYVCVCLYVCVCVSVYLCLELFKCS